MVSIKFFKFHSNQEERNIILKSQISNLFFEFLYTEEKFSIFSFQFATYNFSLLFQKICFETMVSSFWFKADSALQHLY